MPPFRFGVGVVDKLDLVLWHTGGNQLLANVIVHVKVAVVFGVERSQNKSCVSFWSLPSSQIFNTFCTQTFSLLLGSSGSMGFIKRTSRPIFLPSFVTQSILSTEASTAPEWISAARLLSSCTISF